jgi:Ca2+-binding RTX toxin-like protein
LPGNGPPGQPGGVFFDQQILGLTATPIVYSSAAVASVTVKGAIFSTDFQVKAAPPGVPVSLIGGLFTSSLQGPDSPSTWKITGVNAGTLNDTVSFQKVQSLTDGAGDGTFAFQTAGRLSGSLDGGDGVNTLDYSAYKGDIQVIMPLGTATAVGGTVKNIQKIIGSNGDNVLVGNGKQQVIMGGTGRNLIISGPHDPTLIGGAGEDVLVAGSTDFDTKPAALTALMAEWGRRDLPYAACVAHLTGATTEGRNGSYLLNASTVHSNGGGNVLTGGAGLDLFFGSLALDQSDWSSTQGEKFIED